MFSLYFQQQRGLSSLMAGLAFVPMMVLGGVLTPLSARVVERVGARVPIVYGLVLLASWALGLAAIPQTAPVWVVALMLIPIGVTGPLVSPPVTALLLTSVAARQAGVASGIFNTSRQVGGALAIAAFGALTATSSGYLHGLHLSLLITAAIALSAAALSLTLKPLAMTEGSS